MGSEVPTCLSCWCGGLWRSGYEVVEEKGAGSGEDMELNEGSCGWRRDWELEERRDWRGGGLDSGSGKEKGDGVGQKRGTGGGEKIVAGSGDEDW